MSILLMSQVWKLDIPRHIQSFLLALADHAADDGSNIYPSIRYLCWKTGYSERQIQRLIKKLIHDGILKIAIPATSNFPHQYQMNLDACKRKLPFERNDKKSPRMWGAKSNANEVTNSSFRGDITKTPEPQTEPSCKSSQPQKNIFNQVLLIFPKEIGFVMRTEIISKLSSLNNSDAQILLDELAGRIKIESIRNPVGYLSALLKKFRAGQFSRELGLNVKEQREIFDQKNKLNIEIEKKFQDHLKIDKSEPTKEFKEVLARLKKEKWK